MNHLSDEFQRYVDERMRRGERAVDIATEHGLTLQQIQKARARWQERTGAQKLLIKEPVRDAEREREDLEARNRKALQALWIAHPDGPPKQARKTMRTYQPAHLKRPAWV